jgi:dipeptidyl-peptidase-3
MSMGVMRDMDVGKAVYQNYIRNGTMLQLQRLEPGVIIEGAHMWNRQLVGAWAFIKDLAENVIEKKMENGNVFYVVNDFQKLRTLFGQLLWKIQRIKSEADYPAGHDVVENYSAQVDKAIHAEVLLRSQKLNIAPCRGFINSCLVPLMDGDKIVEVAVIYPDNFTHKMLNY